MTLIPPDEEDAQDVQTIIDHNTKQGDWDISLPTYVPGISTSLTQKLKHAQILAARGASAVADIFKRG